MKDPDKLTHSHIEIRNMLDELESVHLPSREFQTMVEQYKNVEQYRTKDKSNMTTEQLTGYYTDLGNMYIALSRDARTYVKMKTDSGMKKEAEESRSPEEEKRLRMARAMERYANEMTGIAEFYRLELYGCEEVQSYTRKLEKSEEKLKTDNALIDEEKAQKVDPFSDLKDITEYFSKAFKGLTGRKYASSAAEKSDEMERGYRYYQAVKKTYYDEDKSLREFLIGKINLHNKLVEKADGPLNGLPKLEVPDINSQTFYQDIQNAVLQKDNKQNPKKDEYGDLMYQKGAKPLGKLAEWMINFRKAVKEVQPVAAKMDAKTQTALDLSEKERQAKASVSGLVDCMKNNPIGKQNDAGLKECLNRVSEQFKTLEADLKNCKEGSPIYVYARERALEPFRSYMTAAVQRYNKVNGKRIQLPDANADTQTFINELWSTVYSHNNDMDASFKAAIGRAHTIVNVPLNEQGKKYDARVARQKEYKKLAAQFKNEVDKSSFPSPAYKEMARLFRKIASAESEPDKEKRAADYQKLYNAASDYLLYKDPALNGKPGKQLSDYEKKRVKFAEDLRDFCKRGGANPEYYKNEKKFTERKAQQPAKGGLGLG